MFSLFQATILGLFQGITELFPVSSLGHTVIIPSLLGWTIDQNSNLFLIFIVATHLATSFVLFIFFFKEWALIIKGIFRSLKNRLIDPADKYERIGWLLVVATIPAGILGLLFEEKFKILFASPRSASFFLILNGLMLYGAEKLISRSKKREAATVNTRNLSWGQSVKIGFAQALALIPGFSRTGAALSGGLLIGLNHEDAAHFSFLLATPIIFAAAVLKLPELIGNQSYAITPIVAGSVASALGAYFSVKFLTKYFEKKTLFPFAAYCVIVGALTLFLRF